MHGVCKEKEEAKKEYVEHLAKGDSAYMLNQDTGNVFDVMVGKVLPGEEVHIQGQKFKVKWDVLPCLVNQKVQAKKNIL